MEDMKQRIEAEIEYVNRKIEQCDEEIEFNNDEKKKWTERKDLYEKMLEIINGANEGAAE